MPFEIVRNDIVNMRVDAIVNTANPQPVIGSGTDAAIHTKAGPGLLEARRKIGTIQAGSAAITPGFGLEAKYVIHAVGPVWRGGLFGEQKILRCCYDAALKLALEYGCDSIAFPLISAGNYGFPRDKALQTALAAFSDFLMEQEMRIYLVVYDRDSFRLSEKLFRNVASYIDENYVHTAAEKQYGQSFVRNRPCPRQREWEEAVHAGCTEEVYPEMSCVLPSQSLAEWLEKTDAGFSETLLKLIDKTGKKDSEIYKRANLSKQHFSKIRNNPEYKPTKPTAIALALALELDLEQTKDLIGRAGYALTNSSKFDLIIQYFIEKKQYDVIQINMTLYEFDQNLLGA